MKNLIVILGISLAACGTTSVLAARPISYPWGCEGTRVQPCTNMGYEVPTTDPVVVEQQVGLVCKNGAESVTPDQHHDKTLIVCR
jgi:hypothetical protein